MNRNTVDSQSIVSEDILEAKNNNINLLALILVFQKAFKAVRTSQEFEKQLNKGTKSTCLYLLERYLSSRYQYREVNADKKILCSMFYGIRNVISASLLVTMYKVHNEPKTTYGILI